MSIRFSILAILGFAVPAVFAAVPEKEVKTAPANLVKNGSFAKDYSGWNKWFVKDAKIQIVKDAPSAGKNALRCTTAEKKKAVFIVCDHVDVKEGVNLNVSCLVKGKADSIQLYVFYWDKDKKYVGEGAIYTVNSSDKWIPVKTSFTTRKKTGKIQFAIRLLNGAVDITDIVVSEAK